MTSVNENKQDPHRQFISSVKERWADQADAIAFCRGKPPGAGSTLNACRCALLHVLELQPPLLCTWGFGCLVYCISADLVAIPAAKQRPTVRCGSPFMPGQRCCT